MLLRNFLPRLVLTWEFHGGLYQVMFLWRFLLRFLVGAWVVCVLYVSNKLLYVHRQSNHPPALLKDIPENFKKRLTSISSSEKVFKEAIPPYEKALDEIGYTYKSTYNPQTTQAPTRNRKRNRQRNITWYSPHGTPASKPTYEGSSSTDTAHV